MGMRYDRLHDLATHRLRGKGPVFNVVSSTVIESGHIKYSYMGSAVFVNCTPVTIFKTHTGWPHTDGLVGDQLELSEAG